MMSLKLSTRRDAIRARGAGKKLAAHAEGIADFVFASSAVIRGDGDLAIGGGEGRDHC